MSTLHARITATINQASTLPDKGLCLDFLTAVIRCTLITAAISALEFVWAEGEPTAHPKLYDHARRLLEPNDGDLIYALDDLIPMVHTAGWRGCAIGWFESRPAPGLRDGLRPELKKWVEFRNNRPGHGVVSANVIADELPRIQALAAAATAILADLLPGVQGDKLVLSSGAGELQLTTLRVSDGHPTLLRRIRRRGTAWKAQAQTLDPVGSVDVAWDINADAALIQAATGSTSAYEARVVEHDGTVWKPLVLLPRRSTSVFCGREKEAAELLAWMNDSESRVCLVFGEGGIGKTTLVLEVLNDLLDGRLPLPAWRPEIICFYSAKQTQWTSGGLRRLHGVHPAVSEAIRDLVRVYEEHPGRDWYSDDARSLISKAQDVFRNLGFTRDDILLVLDNTETLAPRKEDEGSITRYIGEFGKKVCRVVVTSRRHERVEALPLEVAPMSEDEGAELLLRLGEELNATPLIQAGNAKRKKLSRSLGGRPILLEVLARYASHGGRSLDTAMGMVHQDAQRDLGEFLFQDAWERVDEPVREAFLLLLLLGSSADDRLLGWACSAAGIATSVWLDAFEETRFGTVREYGAHLEVLLDPACEDFLTRKLESLGTPEQTKLRQAAKEIESRYRKVIRAEDIYTPDRVSDAFTNPAAKLAKLAAARGDLDEAEQWFEEAVRVDRDNAALWDRFAWFLMMRARNLPRASECAAQAIRIDPTNGDAHFTAGMVAARLGDVEKADAALSGAQANGKPAHLCEAQRARARVRAYEIEFDQDPRAARATLLGQAQGLLDSAEDIQVRSDLDRKHLRECSGTRRKIAKLFRDTRASTQRPQQ